MISAILPHLDTSQSRGYLMHQGKVSVLNKLVIIFALCLIATHCQPATNKGVNEPLSIFPFFLYVKLLLGPG